MMCRHRRAFRRQLRIIGQVARLIAGDFQPMLKLPPHPEVREGLEIMRAAGLRLVTLTNSAPGAVEQQLANSGLAS
jgi:2-haloacid dehalogenase